MNAEHFSSSSAFPLPSLFFSVLPGLRGSSLLVSRVSEPKHRRLCSSGRRRRGTGGRAAAFPESRGPRSPLRPTRSKSGLASIGKGGAARERKREKEGKERMGKGPGPGKEPEAAAQGSEDCVFIVYTVY